MSIRDQAMKLLLDTGLLRILSDFGTPHITGSCAMDLMAWNDLDLYLAADESRLDMYELTAQLNKALRPARFECIVLPEKHQFFYGAELIFLGERWNIDIWVKSEDEIARSAARCRDIAHRLREQPALRRAVMEIKSTLIGQRLYGMDKHPSRHYHSQDIYTAVLDEHVASAEEFSRKHPL